MVRLLSILKKYNAFSMIKQYLKAGVLLFSTTEFLRLGTSKIALELLRETVNFKIQQKLKRKYSMVIQSISPNFSSEVSSKKIWVCWFQGLDSAPDIVKVCIESIYCKFKDYEIIIITEDNRRDYVQFPQFIEEKISQKKITLTHLSDLLRLELLIKYGGIWIDSTVFISEENIPAEILEADLFLFQELKPGSEGHSLPISSWFIVSKKQHPILLSTRAMLYTYWKKNNSLIDYFLLHHFLNISKEYFDKLWENVPKYSNSIPHLLQFELFNEYSEQRMKNIFNLTSVHKLSYKFPEENLKIEGTFFVKVIKEKLNI